MGSRLGVEDFEVRDLGCRIQMILCSALASTAGFRPGDLWGVGHTWRVRGT